MYNTTDLCIFLKEGKKKSSSYFWVVENNNLEQNKLGSLDFIKQFSYSATDS